MEFSADLIDDRVWLGNLAAMQNTVALEGLHITHILSLIETELPVDADDSRVRKHVRVEDVESTDLLVEFDACYDFISGALSEHQGNNVLIHCLAGVSRSATIACMWLMRRHQLSADAALKRLIRARSIVHPNVSFSAQLYLFEQMNNQLDVNHGLYKEFQLERARAAYLDHDTENHGIEQKSNLRQQFCQAFTLPSGHAQCTIIDTYVCRQCQRELFTGADISRHDEGFGLFDWFMKHEVDKRSRFVSDKECQQSVFTHYLQWIMTQIDTPDNVHEDSIKCPGCATVVGKYHLNGAKCPCGRWIVPAFHFDDEKVERKECTKMNIETSNLSSS